MKKQNSNLLIAMSIVCLIFATIVFYITKSPDPADRFVIKQLTPSLEVRAIGPNKLYSLQTQKIWAEGGCGYIIDWGDNTTSPGMPLTADQAVAAQSEWPPHTECFDGLRHVYSIAGKYRVTARILKISDPEGVSPIWQSSVWISIR